MNLVIALLSTRTYITADRIRRVVAGYADCPTDDAFSRMLERDKNEGLAFRRPSLRPCGGDSSSRRELRES